MGIRRRAVVAGLGLAAAGLRPSRPWARARTTALEPIALDRLEVLVRGLNTPEGIAGDRAGNVYVSNQDSTCLVIAADGSRRHVGGAMAANGIAPDGKGGVLVAIFGLLHERPGPLLRLDLGSGALTPLATSAEGRQLGASNFPLLSHDGTIYCTHSTWGPAANIGTTVPGGFVYRATGDGDAEVVARDIRGANGCCFDAGERHLYVAQTASGEILRFPLGPRGPGPRETYGPVLGRVIANETADAIWARAAGGDRDAGYPDGIAFDSQGNLWITLPFANKVVALTPAGELLTIISDAAGRLLDMPTNLAWGGPDLRDLLIVSRRSGTVLRARSPVAGLPLVHQREASP